MYIYTTTCIKEIQEKTVHTFKNTLLSTIIETSFNLLCALLHDDTQ